MRSLLPLASILIVGAMATWSVPSSAATPAARDAIAVNAPPDLSGVWGYYKDDFQGLRESEDVPIDVKLPAGYVRPPPLPFTAEGKRRWEEYKTIIGPQRDYPSAYCATSGMPGMMEWAGEYPIEFIQRPEQLTLIWEPMGEIRRIYFGAANQADTQRQSTRQGYSSGRWEGKTLVVTTDHLLDGVDQWVRPHSDQVKFVERFDLKTDTDGTKFIDYVMTITDPVFYTRPLTIKRRWAREKSRFMQPFACSEELWLAMLDKRRQQLKEGKAPNATMAEIVAERAVTYDDFQKAEAKK